MVNLSNNGSDSEEMTNKSPDRTSSSGGVKTCTDCGTSKTPLWRGGPAGPKSLCNACGIRSRKRRRALLGLSNKEDRKPKKITNSPTCNSESEGSSGRGINGNDKLGDTLKRKLVALGKEVVFQRPRSTMFYQKKRLGEVEQAALLLMSLSCGSVFA